MINLILNNMMNKAIGYYPYDLGAEKSILRMLSNVGEIDNFRLTHAKLRDEEEWNKLVSAVKILSEQDIYIDTNMNSSELNIYDLLFIDGLHHIKPANSQDSVSDQITKILRSLKETALTFNIPIFITANLNRGLLNRPNKRPLLEDLKDSSAISHFSDKIIFIYRDDIYNEDSPDKGTSEIIIAKNNSGPLGTLRLGFSREFCDFTENFIAPKREWGNYYDK